MDWYGQRRKIERAAAWPMLDALRINLAERFEPVEFALIRMINSRFQPI
jgi:hypothetical protein